MKILKIIEISLEIQQTLLHDIDGITYKTKLKLDKEVGGGDLFELCTVTYQIAYPYA